MVDIAQLVAMLFMLAAAVAMSIIIYACYDLKKTVEFEQRIKDYKRCYVFGR